MLQTLEGHTEGVTSVAFSPDGKQIVSGSDDRTVRRWDAATGQQLLPALLSTQSIAKMNLVAFLTLELTCYERYTTGLMERMGGAYSGSMA